MSRRWYAPSPTVQVPRTPIHQLGSVLGSLGCCCYFGSGCFTCIATMPIDVGQTPAGITDPYGGSAETPCEFIVDNGEIVGVNQQVGDTGETVGELRNAGYSDGQISDMMEAYTAQQAASAAGSTPGFCPSAPTHCKAGTGQSIPTLPTKTSGGNAGGSMPLVPKPAPTVAVGQSILGTNPLGFLTQASIIAGIPNWLIFGGVLLFVTSTGGSSGGRKK